MSSSSRRLRRVWRISVIFAHGNGRYSLLSPSLSLSLSLPDCSTHPYKSRANIPRSRNSLRPAAASNRPRLRRITRRPAPPWRPTCEKGSEVTETHGEGERERALIDAVYSRRCCAPRFYPARAHLFPRLRLSLARGGVGFTACCPLKRACPFQGKYSTRAKCSRKPRAVCARGNPRVIRARERFINALIEAARLPKVQLNALYRAIHVCHETQERSLKAR